MSVTAYPLCWPDGWPRIQPASRLNSRFKTGYAAAYENLMSQLRLLGATDPVISSNAPLRRDGKPYTDAMNDDLADPGVAVYFRLKGEPRVMARDGHFTPAENLHAIGHVIEALRSIDRHGGSYMMTRAFSAFAALPAPGANRPWREVLGFDKGSRPQREEILMRYRDLAKTRHPDSPTGSDAKFTELNDARMQAIEELGI